MSVNAAMHLKNLAGFLLKEARRVLSSIFVGNGFAISSRRGPVFNRFSPRPAYVFCRIPRK
jgi:hypothetical protein